MNPSANGWRKFDVMPDVGQVVRLRFRDVLGCYDLDADCFLHDDGKFYRIDPPTEIRRKPIYWQPVSANASSNRS